MAWTWHKVKVYARLAGVIIALLAVLLFILSNHEKVSVKFLWWETPEIGMYLFILIVGVGSVLLWWVIRRIRHVIVETMTLVREDKTRKKLTPKTENEPTR
ncbi:MAG: hypothetical protein JW709_00075 [Sedimentisphaerales bacterium]|nr:hypothetical protein [Sedimentisphaerales bacterium]